MIAAILLAALLGAWASHKFEKRPKLVTYMVNANAIDVTGPQPNYKVHTHSIVVRNEGRVSATNVRVGHASLPDFSVFPSTNYQKDTLPDGSVDLVFPSLRPKEQFTISYMYLPPLVYSDVNTHVRSEEDSAQFLFVIPTRQYSKAVTLAVRYLMFVGFVATVYLLYKVAVDLAVPLFNLVSG